MQKLTCVPIPIPATKFLRLKQSGIDGVWDIALPTWSLRSKEAYRERDAFLDQLVKAFPHCSLWTSGSADEHSVGWQLLSGPDVVSRLEQLDTGGWALFLFPTSPALPLHGMEYMPLPSERFKAFELLDNSSACAAIFSWEDDVEWTVVIRQAIK
jgi:hypothetical protein